MKLIGYRDISCGVEKKKYINYAGLNGRRFVYQGVRVA